MGVYIKGMKMPTSCRACQFAGFGGSRCELNVCMFTGDSQSTLSPERMSSCPLVPVPPHGRLIDADAFKKRMLQGALDAREDSATEEIWLKIMDAVNSLCLDVDEQPTIIPAEEGER